MSNPHELLSRIKKQIEFLMDSRDMSDVDKACLIAIHAELDWVRQMVGTHEQV